jgi:amidase
MGDLWRMGAGELAAAIAAREVSSADVVDAHLERIAAVNPALNACVMVLEDRARAMAAEADRRIAAGETPGPLHGVPFTIKENIDMAGFPSTWGVKALAEAISPVDAPGVERMLAAGAIPIARTNLPDMGLRVHTDSSLRGVTVNPWDRGRTAGGSSGGEAVALATGMSPIGLGNDIGGSLRNPANACGIASIKPSMGRVPDASVVPAPDRLLAVQLMAVQGPMARTVRDVRLGLKVMEGAHPRDPIAVQAPPWTEPDPCRVAVMAEPPGAATDRVVAGVVRAAAAALADAGYAIEEVAPPRFEDLVENWALLLGTDFSTMHPLLQPMMGADGFAFFEAFLEVWPALTDAAAFSHALVVRDAIARDWSAFMERYPLLLSPTWTQLPFAPGWDLGGAERAREVVGIMRPVLPANLLGLPSACVPAGRDTASGMPVGVLLTGRRMHDDQCLAAAEAIEVRLGVETPIDPVA